MLEQIKRYNQGELIDIKKNLKGPTKRIIDDFIKHCSVGAGKSKLANIERNIIKAADTMRCDLTKLTPEIVIEYLSLIKKSDLLPVTKNEARMHLKRFIKWKYEDDVQMIKVLKSFKKEKEINQEKLNPDFLLDDNSIKLLMKSTDSIKFKTLIIVFWETAGRPEEILNLKWKDINFQNKTIRLHSHKTQNFRELPIQESIKHLERLEEEYDFEDRTKEDYVFVSSKRNKPLSVGRLSIALKDISLKALNRAVWAYWIRHSRLTLLQKKLPAKIYEKFADHSIQMANRYSHLTQKDIIDVVRATGGIGYDIKKLTPEQENQLQQQINKLKEEHKNFKTDMLKLVNKLEAVATAALKKKQ